MNGESSKACGSSVATKTTLFVCLLAETEECVSISRETSQTRPGVSLMFQILYISIGREAWWLGCFLALPVTRS